MEEPANVSSILTLQGYNLPPDSVIPAFLFACLSYMIILSCNLLLIITIIKNNSLHQPMYLLLLNLPINDLIGTTALYPLTITRILLDIRTLPHSLCVAQAFLIHVYGTGSVLILSAMAYDRYLAICYPFKYNLIMTGRHLIKLIAGVWLFNLTLMTVLFYLLLRLHRCKSHMVNTYCDNPSLLALVCEDASINNIYGLFTVAIIQLISNGTVLYSYLQILVACFRNKGSDTKSKALQTCATHLIVFLLFECLGLFTIISYRLRNIPLDLRKFIGVSTLIFPPTLNPIIYGLKTKDIRKKLIHMVKRKIFPT